MRSVSSTRVDSSMSMRMKLPYVAACASSYGDVAIGKLGIEVETEMRQLERDIGLQALGGDAVEVACVLVDDGPRRLGVFDSFAEQGGVGAKPF